MAGQFNKEVIGVGGYMAGIGATELGFKVANIEMEPLGKINCSHKAADALGEAINI